MYFEAVNIYIHCVPLDLPYLLCANHKIKRQTIEFVEGSVIIDHEPPLVMEDIVTTSLQNLPSQQNLPSLQNLPSMDDQYEDMALSVTCTSLKDLRAMFKHSLTMLMKNPPYHLKVDRFLIDNDKAYMTFTDNEGTYIPVYI